MANDASDEDSRRGCSSSSSVCGDPFGWYDAAAGHRAVFVFNSTGSGLSYESLLRLVHSIHALLHTHSVAARAPVHSSLCSCPFSGIRSSIATVSATLLCTPMYVQPKLTTEQPVSLSVSDSQHQRTHKPQHMKQTLYRKCVQHHSQPQPKSHADPLALMAYQL